MVVDMNTKRSYTMTSRAAGVEETRTRVLQATMDLTLSVPLVEVTLDRVAGSAGVSVQTVLRHFGSRDGLIEAAAAFGRAQVIDARRAPAGDVTGAVHVVVEEYERVGDGLLLLLAQETSQPTALAITEEGRRLHRKWVSEVWSTEIARSSDPARLTNLLVVATDLYTWKLLRHDRGLSRPVVEAHLNHLIAAIIAAEAES